MPMSRNVKYLVGLATAWTALYPFLFLAVWFVTFAGFVFGAAIGDDAAAPLMTGFFPLFFALFPLHFLTILLSLGLMAFYVVHVIRNTNADETVRIILALGIFMLPFIAMPVYYYLYLWLENPPAWAAAKPAPAPPAAP